MPAVQRRLTLAVLALALIPAACGGGPDADDAESTVRDFADAVSGSDAEKLCQDVLSREARQKVSGATGDDSKDQCEKELGSTRGRPIEIRRIVSKKVDGDRATVIAEVEEGRATRRQVFELENEDGDFRLSSFAQ